MNSDTTFLSYPILLKVLKALKHCLYIAVCDILHSIMHELQNENEFTHYFAHCCFLCVDPALYFDQYLVQ